MTTLMKYALLQIPGWALMALVLLGVVNWNVLSPWAAGSLFVGWVVKDFLLYPFVRSAYESKVKTGSEQLIGAQGIAHEQLAPQGYIQVQGELWHATAEPKTALIAPGTLVRVRAAHGLTLVVSVDGEDPLSS